jgi:hypothetical protein
MAKKKIKIWSQAELIDTFGLTKTKYDAIPLKEWLENNTIQFSEFE